MRQAVVLTSYPFPDDAATASRTHALARVLAEQDEWQVTVIGPGPSGGVRGRTSNPPRHSQGGNQDELPYQIHYYPGPNYSRSNLIARAFGELQQVSRLFRGVRREQPDLVVATVPSPFLLFAPYVLSKKRTIIDVRDLVWEYLAGDKGLRRWAGYALRRFARHAVSRCAAVTATNEHEAKSLHEIAGKAPTVLRNGLAADRFERLVSLKPRASGYDPLHVVYIGNIGVAQELDTVIEAVAGAPEYQVSIVGGGTDAPRIERLVQALGAGNITMTGPLPWDQTLAYCESADVLYGQIGAAYTTAVPTKIFEYVATGRPTLFAVPEGPAAEVIDQFTGIERLPPGDVSRLREKLDTIRQQGDLVGLDASYDRELIRRKYLRESAVRPLIALAERIVTADA